MVNITAGQTVKSNITAGQTDVCRTGLSEVETNVKSQTDLVGNTAGQNIKGSPISECSKTHSDKVDIPDNNLEGEIIAAGQNDRDGQSDKNEKIEINKKNSKETQVEDKKELNEDTAKYDEKNKEEII